MAKGNPANLVKNEERTPEERRENARKAGKASGEARAKNASIRKILLESFHNAEVMTGKDGELITGAEFTAMQIAAGIKKGNIKFVELYLAMIGQKPADEMKLSGQLNTNTELKAIMQQLGGETDGEADGEN